MTKVVKEGNIRGGDGDVDGDDGGDIREQTW